MFENVEKLYERVRQVKERYRDTLFSHSKNINAVGISTKFVRGRDTGELCLMIFVEKKLPESQLRSSEIIPKTIDRVKTDVHQGGNRKS